MTGLQRSTTSFRRQGSSGLVWNDDKNLSGDLNRVKRQNNNNQENKSDGTMMRRSRSEGGGSGHAYRVAKASSPSVDPPSPKVSGCGFCGVFAKPEAAKKRAGRSIHRKS